MSCDFSGSAANALCSFNSIGSPLWPGSVASVVGSRDSGPGNATHGGSSRTIGTSAGGAAATCSCGSGGGRGGRGTKESSAGGVRRDGGAEKGCGGMIGAGSAGRCGGKAGGSDGKEVGRLGGSICGRAFDVLPGTSASFVSTPLCSFALQPSTSRPVA